MDQGFYPRRGSHGGGRNRVFGGGYQRGYLLGCQWQAGAGCAHIVQALTLNYEMALSETPQSETCNDFENYQIRCLDRHARRRLECDAHSSLIWRATVRPERYGRSAEGARLRSPRWRSEEHTSE